MRKRRFLYAILIMLLTVIFLMSPFGASLRSYSVMFISSCLNYRDSVIKKNNIVIDIPGGLQTKKADWYPFVIAFNDNEGLSDYLGEEVGFTVLYNFGHFQLKGGTSSYYNPESPYYSCFYGGYIVKPADQQTKFGFLDDGSINVDKLRMVPEYDQKYLVLPSLGCPMDKRVFDEDILSVDYNTEYAGYNDWVKIDSDIKTNSPVHEYKGFRRGYLQYGKPMGVFDYNENFPVITLKGRAYVRYFDEFGATVVLYIMSPSWETVDECDKQILSYTSIWHTS